MSVHLLFNMTHEQINLLRVIVESGSLARASTVLGLDQSTLSKSIKRIEDRFGVTLLQRHGKGVAPTAEGALLLDQAILLSNQSKLAVEMIRQIKQRSSPALYSLPEAAGVAVAVANECAELVFANAFARMTGHPHDCVTLGVDAGKRIEQQVASGAADIGLLCDPVAATGLVSTPIAEDTMALVFGPVLTAASEAIVPRLRSLAGLPMLLPSWDHSSRRILEQHALRAGVKLDVQAEIADLAALKTLLRQGLGYSVLPMCSVRDEVSRGALSARPLVGRGSRVTLAVICREAARHDPRVAAAVDALTDCLAEVVRQAASGGMRLLPGSASRSAPVRKAMIEAGEHAQAMHV